jgi:hypothetical protein
MATEHRLAPCPWCGQTDKLRRTGAPRGKRWVYCDCGGTGPIALGDDLATVAWNKREPPYAEETLMAITPYDQGRAARRAGKTRLDNPHLYAASGAASAVKWDDGWDVQHADLRKKDEPMATENDYHAGEQARNTGVAIEGNPHPVDSAEAIVWRKGWSDKDREIMAEIDRKDRYIKAEIDRMVDALPGREPVSAQDKMLATGLPEGSFDQSELVYTPAKPKVVQIHFTPETDTAHSSLHVLYDDGAIWLKVWDRRIADPAWVRLDLPPHG